MRSKPYESASAEFLSPVLSVSSAGSIDFLTHSQTGALFSMVDDDSISSDDDDVVVSSDDDEEEDDEVPSALQTSSRTANDASTDSIGDTSLTHEDVKKKKAKMRAILAEFGLDGDLSSQEESIEATSEATSSNDSSFKQEGESSVKQGARGENMLEEDDEKSIESESEFEIESSDESTDPCVDLDDEASSTSGSKLAGGSAAESNDEDLEWEYDIDDEDEEYGIEPLEESPIRKPVRFAPLAPASTKTRGSHQSVESSSEELSEASSDFFGVDDTDRCHVTFSNDPKDRSDDLSREMSVEAASSDETSGDIQSFAEELTHDIKSKSRSGSTTIYTGSSLGRDMEDSDSHISDYLSRSNRSQTGNSAVLGYFGVADAASPQHPKNSVLDGDTDRESEAGSGSTEEIDIVVSESDDEIDAPIEGTEHRYDDSLNFEGSGSCDLNSNDSVHENVSERQKSQRKSIDSSSYDADPFESPRSTTSTSLHLNKLVNEMADLGAYVNQGSSTYFGGNSAQSEDELLRISKSRAHKSQKLKEDSGSAFGTRSMTLTPETSASRPSDAPDSNSSSSSSSSSSTEGGCTHTKKSQGSETESKPAISRQENAPQRGRSANDETAGQKKRTVRRISLDRKKGASVARIEKKMEGKSARRMKKGVEAQQYKSDGQSKTSLYQESSTSASTSQPLKTADKTHVTSATAATIESSDSSSSDDSSPILLIRRQSEPNEEAAKNVEASNTETRSQAVDRPKVLRKANGKSEENDSKRTKVTKANALTKRKNVDVTRSTTENKVIQNRVKVESGSLPGQESSAENAPLNSKNDKSGKQTDEKKQKGKSKRNPKADEENISVEPKMKRGLTKGGKGAATGASSSADELKKTTESVTDTKSKVRTENSGTATKLEKGIGLEDEKSIGGNGARMKYASRKKVEGESRKGRKTTSKPAGLPKAREADRNSKKKKKKRKNEAASNVLQGDERKEEQGPRESKYPSVQSHVFSSGDASHEGAQNREKISEQKGSKRSLEKKNVPVFPESQMEHTVANGRETISQPKTPIAEDKITQTPGNVSHEGSQRREKMSKHKLSKRSLGKDVVSVNVADRRELLYPKTPIAEHKIAQTAEDVSNEGSQRDKKLSKQSSSRRSFGQEFVPIIPESQMQPVADRREILHPKTPIAEYKTTQTPKSSLGKVLAWARLKKSRKDAPASQQIRLEVPMSDSSSESSEDDGSSTSLEAPMQSTQVASKNNLTYEGGIRPSPRDNGIGHNHFSPRKSTGVFRAFLGTRNDHEHQTPKPHSQKAWLHWSKKEDTASNREAGMMLVAPKSVATPGSKGGARESDIVKVQTVAEQRESRREQYILDQKRRNSVVIQAALRGYIQRKQLGPHVRARKVTDPCVSSLSSDHSEILSEEATKSVAEDIEIQELMLHRPTRFRNDEPTVAPKTVAQQREERRRAYILDQQRRSAILIQAALRGHIARRRLGIRFQSKNNRRVPRLSKIDHEIADRNSEIGKPPTSGLVQPQHTLSPEVAKSPSSRRWLPWTKTEEDRPHLKFVDETQKLSTNIQRFDASLYLRQRMYSEEMENKTKSLAEIRDERRRMYLLDLERREAIKIQSAARGFLVRQALVSSGTVAMNSPASFTTRKPSNNATQKHNTPTDKFDRTAYLIDRLQRDEEDRQMKTVSEIREERQLIYVRDLKRREATKIQALVRGHFVRKRYPGYDHMRRYRESIKQNKKKLERQLSFKGAEKPKPTSALRFVKRIIFGKGADETPQKQSDDHQKKQDRFDPYEDTNTEDFFGFKEAKFRHRTCFFEVEKSGRHVVPVQSLTDDARNWKGRSHQERANHASAMKYEQQQAARKEFESKAARMAEAAVQRRLIEEQARLTKKILLIQAGLRGHAARGKERQKRFEKQIEWRSAPGGGEKYNFSSETVSPLGVREPVQAKEGERKAMQESTKPLRTGMRVRKFGDGMQKVRKPMGGSSQANACNKVESHGSTSTDSEGNYWIEEVVDEGSEGQDVIEEIIEELEWDDEELIRSHRSLVSTELIRSQRSLASTELIRSQRSLASTELIRSQRSLFSSGERSGKDQKVVTASNQKEIEGARFPEKLLSDANIRRSGRSPTATLETRSRASSLPKVEPLICLDHKTGIARHEGMTHSAEIGDSWWLPVVRSEDEHAYRQEAYHSSDIFQKYYRRKPQKHFTSNYWEAVRSTNPSGHVSMQSIPFVPAVSKATEASSSSKDVKSVQIDTTPWLPPDKVLGRSIPDGRAEDEEKDSSWVPEYSKQPLPKSRRVDFSGAAAKEEAFRWAPHLASPSKRDNARIEQLISGKPNQITSTNPIFEAAIDVERGIESSDKVDEPEECQNRRKWCIVFGVIFLLLLGGGACAYIFWEDAPWYRQ